jgi:aminopeptidase N
MRRCLVLLLVGMPVLSPAQTATPAAGIPLDVANARAAVISRVRYQLSLSIPSSVGVPVEGGNTLTFDLAKGFGPLVIDFAPGRDRVRAVTANGKPSAFTWINGHIVVPAADLAIGSNRIEVAFLAGDASLNRDADFLYALFVPARAHLAIPCFDQPNLKARWSLTVTAPAKWQVVSNGAESSREAQGDRVSVRFAETEPLSTYLFSFVAGDFKLETAERAGRTFRMFHRETDAVKVARNKDAIFDLHARALAFLEDYTAIPYAFGKFDFVLIPSFQFGGMEHAGKILYNAPGLFLDESATQNQHLGRASVIAHETAHMWFGDLVTMRWFDDVWMKEVFANFMAAKIVNPSFPEVNHELRFLLSHYPAAYEVDRTPGTNAIRQPLGNLSEAGSLYGAIIYQKAPVIMRHLEDLMGERAFRDGLRAYLKQYAFGNATWGDLIRILDERTPADLAAWSRVWVEERGRPTIRTTVGARDGRVAALTVTQEDRLWSRPLVWPQQLRLTLGYADRMERVTVSISGRTSEVREAVGKPQPLYVLANGEGWGYGDFVLDPASLAYLLRSLPDIGDPVTRGSAWVTLWDGMLSNDPSPAALVDLAMRALPRETDEQLTQRVLGYLRSAWWRFLRPGDRTDRQRSLEELLKHGMTSAKTASQKAAWFGALRDVAMTGETTAWLRRVWDRQEAIPGLPLAEPDFVALAQELAVREIEGWRQTLETELGRIQNPDRRARFAFEMPSLSADQAERDRWFESLKDVANRRREPWVLGGLANLHHPLRATQSAKYVEPSLRLLQEIQQTGDIFFPTRWMATTLSGHNTRDVASTVRQFLDGLPASYPERLKNIVLQTADDLFRSTEMLATPTGRH